MAIKPKVFPMEAQAVLRGLCSVWFASSLLVSLFYYSFTVRNRKIETGGIETILTFASVSLKKIETDLLGSWWP